MLQEGKCYRDNNHRTITIGGRIRDYSESKPWVWSIGGDWYHEETGAFINFSRTAGHVLMDVDARSSISDHTEIETGNKLTPA